MNITIGADPEVFVMNANGFLPAPGLVPGDKKRPHVVPRGAIQVDGLALEFNIDPVSTEEDFVISLNEVMDELSSRLPEGASIARVPTARFEDEQMAKLHPASLLIGCDPDFNAYTGGAANPPLVHRGGVRHAGGHIHVGWTNDADIRDPSHLGACMSLVRLMDQRLGIPSVLLDDDTERRTSYGRAGSFRPRPYGVEYRVLSNFWLQKEEYVRWVYRVVKQITDDEVEDVDPFDEAVDIIGESDVSMAELFIEENGLDMP